MKQTFLDILSCAKCGGDDLVVESRAAGGDEILDGSVCCPCGHVWPIVRGIPRFVDSDQYVDNFSFEWQLHKKTQLDNQRSDRSSRAFVEKTHLCPGDFSGQQVLDVGVGTGRFADVLTRAGAHVTGIDLSYAVETAMENVGRRPGCNIAQADLFDLPFREASFDLIYSIGVLHHTPDCRRAFESLVSYLKPGGTIVIWVYSAHTWMPGSILETANRFWRSVTTRLPSRLLYALCLAELPYYFLRKLPGCEQALHMMLPGIIYHALPKTNDHADIKEHVLDSFDWYSPKYQSKHTYPEVFEWFEECGLESIRILPEPVSVSGKKSKVRARDVRTHRREAHV